MDTRWLEDVLALLEEGTLNRAAARRNVTQPAFSRRIRAFEDWIGAEDGNFEWVQNVYERTDLLDAEFPYAFRQNLVQPIYRTAAGGCEMREFNSPPRNPDTTPVSGTAPEPDEEEDQEEEEEEEEEGEGEGTGGIG